MHWKNYDTSAAVGKKGISWANSEEIRPVALAISKLHLSEGTR